MRGRVDQRINKMLFYRDAKGLAEEALALADENTRLREVARNLSTTLSAYDWDHEEETSEDQPLCPHCSVLLDAIEALDAVLAGGADGNDRPDTRIYDQETA